MNHVLIVAASPIIRIVIARTIERIYLRPIPVSPEIALDTLNDRQPDVVILDADTHEELLDPLLAELQRRRRASEDRRPRVVLIEEADRRQGEPRFAGLVDAAVPKPITPDTLQPVVERVINAS